MSYQEANFPLSNCPRSIATLRAILAMMTRCSGVSVLLAILFLGRIGGCVSDKVEEGGLVSLYQQTLVGKGPQQRADTEGREALAPLGLLQPEPEPVVPQLETTTDPETGKEVYDLTIEEAVLRAIANSPEIRVVSFDPSIAREEIKKEAAEFDLTAFGRVNYEKQDNPINSFSTIGQSNSRLAESGIKQKFTTGSEWAVSYAMTRNWDDLPGRPLPTRYEPIFAFQVRQPLLRDAWEKVNLAGVDIARLNHEIALLSFRQKAEDVSTQIISAYWLLFQTRRNLDIQKELLNRAVETLQRLRGREEIDATAVQVKQTEASVKAREALLVQVRKSVVDAQEELVRIMADAQMNLLKRFEILPATAPNTQILALDDSELLRTAIDNHPIIQQARIAITIADINIDVAKNQEMPRLDLVASASFQGLAKEEGGAQDRLNSGEYASYALGFSFEYPLGNPAQRAEIRAMADFNTSLAQLAQATGTVLELHQLRTALPVVTGREDHSGQGNESGVSQPDMSGEQKSG